MNEIGALTSRAAAIERGGRGWDRPRRARTSRGIVGWRRPHVVARTRRGRRDATRAADRP